MTPEHPITMQQERLSTRYASASKARKLEDSVHGAAQIGDVKQLERHIALGERNGQAQSLVLEQREAGMGMMPLHVACEHGHLEVVQFLIGKGVRVNEGDSNGITAMHLASIGNKREICVSLLGAHASVTSQDMDGDLPLHWAATKGHCGIIELLLQHGSPVDPVNHLGWTPLHRAVFSGRRQATETLVAHGASLMARNQDGNTPLHMACHANQVPVIELLLMLGANVDTLNNHQQTAVDLCITSKALELLQPPERVRVHVKCELQQPSTSLPGDNTQQEHSGAAAAVAVSSTKESSDSVDTRAQSPGEGSSVMNMRGPGPSQDKDVEWVAAYVAGSVQPLRLGTGPVLPPVGSNNSEEPQHLMDEDSRHSVEALMQHTRPTSANKRFLAKYSLEKLGLFAPS